MVFESHAARYLREQRVVFAEADVEAGSEPPSALPDENRPACNDVAVVPLDAQALRIAVSAVA